MGRQMMKSLAALCGMAILAMTCAPAPTLARCGGDCNRTVSGTKIKTSYSHRTVRRVRNITRYRDITNTRRVTHTRRVVHVTRIQPVRRVNVVTRVHYRTKVKRVDQHIRLSRMPAGITNGTRHVRWTRNGDRVSTVYRQRVVRPVRYVKRYRHVYRTRYVTYIHRRASGRTLRPIVRVRYVTHVRNGADS
jgi:hypothetical protein